MELVYLWVEDYKNIQKQGFNFSPRFECKFYDEYDKHGRLKNNCNLIIDKNHNYIPDFFSKNINITAIVGKNGSGKSSIIEIIEKIYIDNDVIGGIIFCFEIDGQKVGISNIKIEHTGSFDIDIIEFTLPVIGNFHPHDLDFNFLTYSAEIPYPNKDDRKKFFYERSMAISLDEKDIYDIASNYLDSDFNLSSFMFLPEKIYISQNQEKLRSLLEAIKPEIIARSNNPESGVPYEDAHNEREDFHTENILVAYYVYQFIKNDLSNDVFDILYTEPYSTTNNLEELENLYNEDKYGFNNDYSLNEFNELQSNRVFEKDTLNIREKELINKYKWFLKFDFEDKERRKYSDLSHGERIIYGQLLNIYHHSNHLVDKAMLVLLDEPDLALHPQWQKNYIDELFNSVYYLNKKLHFIFTSHSPFLLSDIPKQNIIFLDTYRKDENTNQKEGNCKVVEGLSQTFGANIHTLLSDSFFMEDGLMGEFAKRKINEIKRFYDVFTKYQDNKKIKKGYKWIYLKKRKKFWHIQSIIGEPFLKTVIKNYLDEIENILFEDKAKKIAIKRFINEFGKEAVSEVINNVKD